MKHSGSYNINSEHRDPEMEIERLRVQAIVGWEKEARNLAWFGLQNGMSVLELGSGPGFITEQLLTMLPDSSVTALEVDSVLIEKAKSYIGKKAGNRLQFVEASVMNTGLPSDSFDFAIARLLFQHLPDPAGAAKEALRVLKPGGKLVITDVDDAIWGIIDPVIPELGPVLEKYAHAQATKGGNRMIGRELWRILESSGFTEPDLEAVVIHSDESGIEAFLPQFDPDRLQPLVKIGLISEEETERLRDSREMFLAASYPYILTVMLMACGKKSGLHT